MKDNTEIDFIHKLTLELLDEFSKLCETAEVEYFLSGGTLLGAVRHQGFIPWDDDADIMMLRDDYMRLLKVQKNYLDTRQYQILSVNDNTYPRDFARFVRKDYFKTDECVEDNICPYVGIDIFPVDFVPSNKIIFELLYQFLSFFKRLMGVYGSKKNTGVTEITRFLRNMFRPVVSLIGGYRLARVVQTIELTSNRLCNKSVAALSGINGRKEKWEYEDYLPKMKLKFEGLYFNCPLNYDIYLKNLYGDYMKLPPENKRVTHGISILKR